VLLEYRIENNRGYEINHPSNQASVGRPVKKASEETWFYAGRNV